MANSWKSAASRQSVANRLDEAMQESPRTYNQTGAQLENLFFRDARDKEHYLYLVEGIIMRIRQNGQNFIRIEPTPPGMQMAVDNSWKDPRVREVMIEQLDEAIEESGLALSRTGTEMESHIFQKSRHRVEYHQFVSKRTYYLSMSAKKRKNQQMPEDDSWKTESARQCVVNKINDAMQQSGIAWGANGMQLENYYFQETCTKEEYNDYVDTCLSSINARVQNQPARSSARSRPTPYQRPARNNVRSN